MRGIGLWSVFLLVPVGCGMFDPDPPRVDTRWAQDARTVVSPDTPGGDPKAVVVDFGPADARERDELDDLADEELTEGLAELGAGVYRLESPTILRGGALEIRGKGPHKTRLELDTESLGSLMLQGPTRFVLRDLTVVGFTGGGIRIKGCPEVVIENVHFAGLRFGLDLESSTAQIGSSVFAGCQEGIHMVGGEVSVVASAFTECWAGISGRARLNVEASVFVENRDAIKVRLDRRSRVVGCLFAGEKQQLAWSGRPRDASRNLAHEAYIGQKLGRQTNRVLLALDEFPDRLREGLPPGFDLPTVHLALRRAELRGDLDPPEQLEEVRLDRAIQHAGVCQEAATRGDMGRARDAARLALSYLGEIPLDEVPEVAEIASLVQ